MNRLSLKSISCTLAWIFLLCPNVLLAQNNDLVNYSNPKSYEIGGIQVSGVNSLDAGSIILLSGLSYGQKITIPGEALSEAINKLWKQNIFGNIEIYITSIEGNIVYLSIELDELPRVNKLEITGIKKYDASKLEDEIEIKANDVITDNKINRVRRKAINFYKEKGFLNADIEVIKKFDTASNGLNLTFHVKKGNKVKIQSIHVTGNVAPFIENKEESYHGIKQFYRKVMNQDELAFSTKQIHGKLKKTKQKNFFRFWKRSKFVEPNFREDLKTLTTAYNNSGFRDMRILRDSLIVIDDKTVRLEIEMSEGRPYFFGDISYVGNTKYSNEQLAYILNIKKGEVFNEEKLQQNLTFNPNQGDINSLYYDDGYLTFSAIPVETRVENDTIDIEIRIREGKQARINKVSIDGNTRTNDHVIIRELRVYPGQLFSRSNLINSMNELRQLRYFNDQTITPDVKPNIEEGTADIVYKLEEVGSDQVELSGGWGGGMIVGTIGLSFNNFSIQNVFRKDRWKPLPSGDGQKLSLRAQTNGSQYYSFSASYTEPWMGGRKPYAFSLSAYTTMQSNGYKKGNALRGWMTINGGSVGLGQRLMLPDPYFTLYQSISYQQYDVYNYGIQFPINDGIYNNVNYNISFGRQNLDGSIFPKNGSELSMNVQLTPPYSLFGNKNYGDPSLTDQERWKWVEYYKWNFKASWFMNPIQNLVINARLRFGAIGQYTKGVGYSPFERFQLGGDGMTGYSYSGQEEIGMRGYTNQSLSPEGGATAFNKLTLEVRYPITLNPAATIYGLVFVEAGNSWENPKHFNPFQNYRSAGVGVRLFLAAMGMFGLDWGYGFDEVPGNPSANKSQFHFSINQSLD